MLAAYITGMASTLVAFVIWQAIYHHRRLDRHYRILGLIAVAQDTCDLWAAGYESDLRMTRQIRQLNDAILEVQGNE